MARRPDDVLQDLLTALDAALSGRWDDVHAIVQRHEGDPIADWLHGLHHKVEGDAVNARYWYARTPMSPDRFADPRVELRAVHHDLVHETLL